MEINLVGSEVPKTHLYVAAAVEVSQSKVTTFGFPAIAVIVVPAGGLSKLNVLSGPAFGSRPST